MKDNNLRKAFKEVNTILEYVPKEEKNKISKKLLEFMDKNEDKDYEFKLDLEKNLDNQNIMRETKTLLTMIYKDYWVTKEEKKALEEISYKNEEKYNEKYDIDNIWNQRESVNISNNINQEMVIYKESVFQKVVEMIKSFIRRDKDVDIGSSIEMENGNKYITILKCKINELNYFLISNIEDEKENLLIEKHSKSNYVRVIKDYNEIKMILEKM